MVARNTPTRRTRELFPLGRTVATPGALEAIENDGDPIGSFIFRHVTGDWSEMDQEDRLANSESITNGTRIFSAYKTSKGTRVWVITEADRSATTVLLPEEY